jgi:hypothetical protein
MRQCLRRDHEILFAVADATVILSPRNFSSVGREVGTGDMVMLADFLNFAKLGYINCRP